MQSVMLVYPLVVCMSRQPLLRRPMWPLFGVEGGRPVVRNVVTHNTVGGDA